METSSLNTNPFFQVMALEKAAIAKARAEKKHLQFTSKGGPMNSPIYRMEDDGESSVTIKKFDELELKGDVVYIYDAPQLTGDAREKLQKLLDSPANETTLIVTAFPFDTIFEGKHLETVDVTV